MKDKYIYPDIYSPEALYDETFLLKLRIQELEFWLEKMQEDFHEEKRIRIKSERWIR